MRSFTIHIFIGIFNFRRHQIAARIPHIEMAYDHLTTLPTCPSKDRPRVLYMFVFAFYEILLSDRGCECVSVWCASAERRSEKGIHISKSAAIFRTPKGIYLRHNNAFC